MAKLQDAGFNVALFGRTPTPRHEPRAPAIRCSKPRSLAMMHVRVFHNGHEVRHRIMLDEVTSKAGSWSYEASALLNGRTACDVTLAGKYYAVIDPGVDGVICTEGCFSKAEIENFARLTAAAEHRRIVAAAKAEAERQESNERAMAEMRERVRRARTGEHVPSKKPEEE